MAAIRRRYRFIRSASRPKRQGAWTGVGILGVTLTQNVTSSYYLWSDLTSQRLNMSGRGVHQRTLLWIGVSPGDLIGALNLAWSVYVHQTDATNDVPASATLSPWAQWSSLAEKTPLDMGFRTMISNAGTSQSASFGTSLQRDIKVKRRMDDTDALMLSLDFAPQSGTGQTLRLWVASRTYVSW